MITNRATTEPAAGIIMVPSRMAKRVFCREVTFAKVKPAMEQKNNHQHSRYAGNEERIKKLARKFIFSKALFTFVHR